MSKATFDARKFNRSPNASFSEVLEASLSRRSIMKGGAGMAALGIFSTFGITACGGENKPLDMSSNESSATLGFESIPGSLTDAITVASGYTASVLAPWGTPFNSSANAWRDGGTNTAED